jgi:hypothetical protein
VSNKIIESFKGEVKQENVLGAGEDESISQPIVDKNVKKIGEYRYVSDEIPITVIVERRKGEFVPVYRLEISAISPTTEIIIEGVRQELIRRVNLGIAEINDYKNVNLVEEKFERMIEILIKNIFLKAMKKQKNSWLLI